MVEVEKNTSSDCNFLFIISAPSGTGKTTICRYLLNKYNDLKLSISSTTRKPRGREVNGKDYFFLSNDDFLEKIGKKDDFVIKPKIDKNKMYNDDNDLHPGDVIEHEKYGMGVVVSIDGSIATISFRKDGLKKLMKNHKSIRKV